MAAVFRPPEQLTWQVRYRYGDDLERKALVEALWRAPRFAPFRRFALHPSISDIENRNGETCVWFTDLRYDLQVLPDTFRYGFCRNDAKSGWQLYRLRYFSKGSRQLLEPSPSNQ
jgi:inner membrane protein